MKGTCPYLTSTGTDFGDGLPLRRRDGVVAASHLKMFKGQVSRRTTLGDLLMAGFECEVVGSPYAIPGSHELCRSSGCLSHVSAMALGWLGVCKTRDIPAQHHVYDPWPSSASAIQIEIFKI